MPGPDTALFYWLNATSTSPVWLVPIARFVTQELPEWIFAGMAGAFVVGSVGVRRSVVRVLIALAIAWISARVVQNLFPMPRPFSLGIGTAWMTHGGSPGFPSTHATVAFAFGFVVAASTRNMLYAAIGMALAALIGWSRVCLGLHFPVDVLGGAAIGGVSAWLSGLVPLTRLSGVSIKREISPQPAPGRSWPKTG